MTDVREGPAVPTHGIWAFRFDVQKLRKRLGLTQRAFAKLLHYSQAQVAKVEAGKAPPTLAFAAAMDEVANTGEVYQDILKRMLRDAALPEWFGPYFELEQRAKVITDYSAIFCKGILQTPEYAEAVVRAAQPRETNEQIRELVAMRMRRAEVLYRANPPELWSVIHEGVLRSQVGGEAVMRGQIENLLALGRLPHVTLQVLPFSAGASPSHVSFTMLAVEGASPNAVYSETALGGQVDYSPAAVAFGSTTCDRLRMAAANEQESAEILRSIAKGA
ncbi:helix-turn-helix domain-containing protein [Streptomyces sp. NPDC002248]